MKTVGRVLTIATNAFQEVLRDRVLYLLCFYIFLMVMAVWLLPEISTGTEKKILMDVGLAAIDVLSLMVAVFVGAGLINKEIEKRTVLSLLAKPIGRAEFVIGKHLGLTGVLAVLVAAMGAIYLGFLQWAEVTYPLVSIVVTLVYLLLMLSLVTAVALAFGVFSSPLLATMITFGVYLIGQFSRDLVTFGQLVPNLGFQRFTQAIYLILPDLARLNLKNEAVHGVLPDPLILGLNAGYGLLYLLLMLAIATILFSQREF